MTDFKRDFFSIIKSALTGEKVEISQNFNWEKAYKLAQSHRITPIIYYGVINSRCNITSELFEKIESKTYSGLSISLKQLYELEKLYEVFEKNGIDYMPLKGAVIKSFYPKPEMRYMGDIDILIKTQQYETIQDSLNSMGYKKAYESDHELAWNKKSIYLELHKRLIPSYNKDFYEYFGSGWQLAHKKSKYRYELSDEDTFIYIITHFAKHYRDGHVEIRNLLDIKVYLSAKPNLDFVYIEQELKKLSLYDFYQNCINTFDYWFNNLEPTPITTAITDKVLLSTYKAEEMGAISYAVKKSKSIKSIRLIKFQKVFWLVFLPYENMTYKYPFLKKHSYLLPVMWVYRCILFFLRKGRRLKP